ncbi:acyltransferase family protein [Microbacterium sp. nov. GSS16]|uniref:acyltransferase family protein n=1 Tax=Microbacterium sp. nov. GSS16 TaxID=3019890 RepID=UPI0023053ECB|nr:acyltransferase [Microbacterium sp. nov. GSS16]WCD92893.1 acyltransferase [Microbacterium sp. nov. GSS16]
MVTSHATLYTAERLDDSLGIWRPGGVGVDIFFVISGFVMSISTTKLVGESTGWRTFALRRIVRIVPLYWIATTAKLATMLVLPAAVLHAQLDPVKAVASYLFIPTRNAEGDLSPLLAVGWTLNFEMAFYALFTVALLLRVRPLWFCAAALSLLATASLVRPEHGPPGMFYFDPVVLYFVVGMVIGQWTVNGSKPQLAAWLGATLALWFLIEVVGSGFAPHGLGLFAQRVGVSAGLLIVVLCEPFLSGRLPKPLLFLGDASYSLYLFHPLVAPIVPIALGIVGITNPVVSIVLCIVAAVCGAGVIYRFVEKPVTRSLQAWMPGLRPRRTGTAEAPVPRR